MTEDLAYELVGRLSAITGTSWPDRTVEAWVELLVDIDDYDAALDATEAVRKSWKKTDRPPFAVWNDAYGLALVRRREAKSREEQHGQRYEAISLTTHLDRSLARGDLNEIRTWARHAAKWRTGATDTFGQTVMWAGELVRWFQVEGRQHYLEEAL